MDELLLYELPICVRDMMEDELCDVDPGSLLLENVNRHFHGNYSCVGSLASGLSSLMSNTVSLIVQYPPGEPPLSPRVMSECEMCSPGAAEVRLGPGQSLPVYRGDLVRLVCSLTSMGRPGHASYTWTLDGEEVMSEYTQSLNLDTGGLAGVHQVRD